MTIATASAHTTHTRLDAPSSTPTPRRRLLRSTAAVIAGLFVVAVTSTVTDEVFRALHVFPPRDQLMYGSGLFLLALAYRTLYSILGCYLAARLAPSAPMRHALILGVIGLVLSVVGVIVNIQRHLGPNWYPIALVVTALPCAWLGGVLHRSRQR
jgi:hypothetical protein